jgi:hypothetical protein
MMIGLHTLWLPILLSAVFVFIASSVVHMVLPWHKSDYARLPDEDRARAVIGALAIPPDDYVVPRPLTRADLGSPAFQEKYKTGPVIVMTVRPNGPFAMGRTLGTWFVYCLVMSLFAAYIASRALAPGVPYRAVFRFAGATAFIGYVAALWQFSIWYGRKWSTTIKSTIDGLIYACLTAATFAWLWPSG